MNEQTKQATQTIGRLKRKANGEKRLQGWRETYAEQGLGGEFILTAELNDATYTEEEARMVTELFSKQIDNLLF